jgi:outer membrane protein insertion porin family/translocation and assembly module TamA
MRGQRLLRRGLAAVVQAVLVLLAVVGGVARLAAQSVDDQREAPEVRRLVLNGADHVDTRDLRRSIATQASQCKNLAFEIFCAFSKSSTFFDRHFLDREELKRDVLRIRVYYWKRGFREATVDTTVTPNGERAVNVTFDINTGPPTAVTALRIDYDSTLISARRARRLTMLRQGEPLNLLTLDSMRLAFQAEMWNRGFSDAIVDTAVAVNNETRQAGIYLRVDKRWPTTVGKLTVVGNQRIDTRTILNIILLREGQPYKLDEALESQRSLYESNLFRTATILPAEGDSIKSVEVQVVEAPLHEARIGGGFNSFDFLQVDGRFTNFNILGGARRLDITGSLSNLFASALQGTWPFIDIVPDLLGQQSPFLEPNWGVSVDFRQPAFFRPRNQFGVGVFAHRRSEPGIFVDQGYGAAANITRQIAIRAPATLGYRYEVTRVDASDVYFCLNYGVCDTTTINTVRSHQTLSPLSLSGFIDRSDQPFNPTRGYVARAEFEYASRYTGSDYRYYRAYADGATYWHPSGRPDVIASNLRLGIVVPMAGPSGEDVLHPRKRFYAGGAMSVRGYGENQLGPRVLTIPQATLRGLNGADTTASRCPISTPVTQCNPNAPGLEDSDFDPRPLGGTSLIMASVEYRFPLARKLDGAVFVDGAIVGEGQIQSLTDLSHAASLQGATSAITPGFGIRYLSPVGPIRVDIGINPRLTEQLPVVTEDSQIRQNLVPLQQTRTFRTGGKTILDRLVLHFSIGQAY